MESTKVFWVLRKGGIFLPQENMRGNRPFFQIYRVLVCHLRIVWSIEHSRTTWFQKSV